MKVSHHCLLDSRVALKKSNDMPIYFPLHMVCIYVFSLELLRIFHLPGCLEISWQYLGWIMYWVLGGPRLRCFSSEKCSCTDSLIICYCFGEIATILLLGCGNGWLFSPSQCLRPHLGWLRWLEMAGMLSWSYMSGALAVAWFLGSSYGICWNVQDGFFTDMDLDVWMIWELTVCLSIQPVHVVATARQSQDSWTSYMLACFP